MPATLPSALTQEKLKVHSAASWVELWAIQSAVGTGVFITSHPTSITFAGIVWDPFPISRSDDTRDTQGSVPFITVSVSNIDRAIQVELDAGNLIDRLAVKYLVNTANLAAAATTERFRILEAEVDDLVATFKLGPASPMEMDFPSRRFQRNRCDHVYGGTGCGYDTARAGALATCDRTLLGANGCKVHGDDEVTAGKPREHTANYGGCPSLLRGPFL